MSLAERIRSIHAYASQGKSETEIAALVGVEIGDVQMVLTTVTMPSGPVELPTASKSRQSPMWDGVRWVADGAPRVVACPFTYDTPGLLDGCDIWTPQDGDILLDGWIEVDIGWDGITPQADIGLFESVSQGWFGSLLLLACYNASSVGGVPLDDNSVDVVIPSGLPWGGVRVGSWGLSLSALQGMGNLLNSYHVLADTQPDVATWYGGNKASRFEMDAPSTGPTNQAEQFLSFTARFVPLRFVGASPLKLAVTQTGEIGGGDPASTRGAATLYLLVATPAGG